jgi:hypothetical protein
MVLPKLEYSFNILIYKALGICFKGGPGHHLYPSTHHLLDLFLLSYFFHLSSILIILVDKMVDWKDAGR